MLVSAVCLSGPCGIRRGWERKWVVIKTVGMEEARPEANVEKHLKESAKDLSVDHLCHTLRRHTQPFERELAAFPVLVLLSQSPGRERPTQGQTSDHQGRKEGPPYRCLMATSTPYPRPGSQPALLSFPGQSPEAAPVTIFCSQNFRVPSLARVT